MTFPSTVFVPGTTITHEWLNGVNDAIVDGAANINYTPPFTGGVTTTVGNKLAQTVSVIDFGAVGDGVTDDTAAIQAAVDYSILNGPAIFMPAGTYLVTDTITCSSKVQIIGEHYSMSAIDNGTKINFAPTTAKDLFVLGSGAGFTDGYSFQNLYIIGNSANSSGNSNRAFNFTKVIKSTFKNMRVDSFRTAFKISGSINNRFEYIQAANHYVSVISYEGDYSTTDVWEQCYISNAPIGVQTNGINLGIRFTNTVFESITTYGVNIVKETYGLSFVNCYSEDVPSANVSTNAMFRVGYDGSVSAITSQLSVIGGFYSGRNAGLVGSFLDVDSTYGVNIGGMIVARYSTCINTTTNTPTNQIVVNGWTAVAIGTMISDATKVSGYYPRGVVNSGFKNDQAIKVQTGAIDNLTSATQIIANRALLTGAAIAVNPTEICLGNVTATTVGAAGGASALPATPLGYLTAYIGTQQVKIPYYRA